MDPEGVVNRFVTPLSSICTGRLATVLATVTLLGWPNPYLCEFVKATKVKWRNTLGNSYVSYVNKPRYLMFCAFCSFG
jgi:hypothetical protein